MRAHCSGGISSRGCYSAASRKVTDLTTLADCNLPSGFNSKIRQNNLAKFFFFFVRGSHILDSRLRRKRSDSATNNGLDKKLKDGPLAIPLFSTKFPFSITAST